VGSPPRSKRFNDVYWSKVGGLTEKRYVFLDGNGLPARWIGRQRFTIGELGFGAGLNFLLTAAAWTETQPAAARLAYIAFEQFPMSRDELAPAISAFDGIFDTASTLLKAWQPNREMLAAVPFPGVELTIFFSDANRRLPMTEFAVDSWYLDGFAPAKNPELWSAELMQGVFERTAPGGTFATYAAAGWVRRNLQSAGFTAEKRQGFAGKKEMMAGIKQTGI
jgi:tRNA U34 5-methylaminomethyl-2-thiouridine-forming methyltransferase MnmC